MVFNEVVNILANATSLPLRLISNDKVEECVIYKITPINDNGIKRQDRLEIKIVGYDLEQVELQDLNIRKALLSFGDREDYFTSIELNGGGMMGGGMDKDHFAGTLTKYSFYILTSKSEVN